MQYGSLFWASAILLAAPLPSQTCRLAADVRTGSGSSSPQFLTCSPDGTLFFVATTAAHGRELWTYSAARGAKLLKDINPGSASSSPSPGAAKFAFCGKTMFFVANDGRTGSELWKTDGSTAGTVLVKDINPGPSSSFAGQFTCLGSLVLFSATTAANGGELWKTDGTGAGTMIVKDIFPGRGTSKPEWFQGYKGKLYFAATDADDREVWESDGTAAGTRQVTDIHRTGSSNPTYLASCPDAFGSLRIFMTAFEPRTGAELWVLESRGYRLVKDIYPGAHPKSSAPWRTVSCNGRVFFAANDGVHGVEEWSSDATPAGTVMLKDFNPGRASGNAAYRVCCGEKLYMNPNRPANGREIWASDGTAAGTVVVDLVPGPAPSNPNPTAAVGNRLYFDGSTAAMPRELTVTNGTAAGTKQVCDIYPGRSGSAPLDGELCNGRLYFAASHPTTGRELWVLDLPGASVQHIGSRMFATDPGETCGKRHPVMTSTPPFLGGTATLSGACGPKAHVGVILLSPTPVTPTRIPSGCWSWLDPGSFLFVGLVQPPRWTFPCDIPKDTALNGATFVMQTWWVNVRTVTPFQLTNGVVMTAGL